MTKQETADQTALLAPNQMTKSGRAASQKPARVNADGTRQNHSAEWGVPPWYRQHGLAGKRGSPFRKIRGGLSVAFKSSPPRQEGVALRGHGPDRGQKETLQGVDAGVRCPDPHRTNRRPRHAPAPRPGPKKRVSQGDDQVPHPRTRSPPDAQDWPSWGCFAEGVTTETGQTVRRETAFSSPAIFPPDTTFDTTRGVCAVVALRKSLIKWRARRDSNAGPSA